MFGCLRRLGCLVILLALAAGGYWYWEQHRARESTSTRAGVWHPVSAADADRAAAAVGALSSGRGRVFANLTPSEAVAYLILEGAHQLPSSAQGVHAMVRGDTLYAKALVPLRDIGGARALGPIAALVSARDTVQLGGTVDVLRTGLAEFRVTYVALRNLEVPRGAIPRLVKQLRHPPADTSTLLAPDALPLPLPPYIGDIRIGNGKITLYKNVSQ